MISKKDIPLVLLKVIEKIAQNNLDSIELSKEDNTYYCFKELDKQSNSFFKIYIDGGKIINNYDRNKYYYQWKPTSAENNGISGLQGNVDDTANQFNLWLDLIKEFNDTSSLHDDNFTKEYAEFYFDEFKITDENANSVPFNPNQQNLIELYIDSLEKTIRKTEVEIDASFSTEILKDLNEIKSSLPNSTKNQVMKKITKVFGKLYKHSKDFAKEIIKEAKKALIKKLIENGIDYAKKITEMIT